MRQFPAILGALVLFCAPGCAQPSMNNDAFTSPDVASLADAVRRGDEAEIRRQLERIDADTHGSDGSSLLAEAIRREQPGSVRALLAGGADPNRPDARGDTAVHAAAFSGNAGLLRAVLEGGGDPDVRNPHTGATPLVSALLSPEAGQYEVLLEAGADPGVADLNGDTPLHVAARTNAGAAILRLLEAGASPLATNAGGRSFQPYYFGYRRELLNDRALDERRRIVAWLKANGVPLEASVQDTD